ncbi:MAG: ABC transporter substrate-binding protein [Acidimicrobiales bacterium]
MKVIGAGRAADVGRRVMATRRRRRGTWIAVLPLLVSAACSGAGSTPDDGTVRVGYLPIIAELPLFVAVENGHFAAQDLDVELVRFESSPAASVALLAGEVDAVASIATATALSIEARDPGSIQFFALDAEDTEDCLSAIVANPDAGVSDIADLRGQTVGIFPGPTAATFYDLVFEQHGLDPDLDLTTIELEPSLQLPALRDGQFDVLATYEPIATTAALQDGAVRVADCPIERTVGAPWQAGSWILSDEFARAHPGDAEGLVDGVYSAIDDLRAEPDAARPFLAEYTSIPADVASSVPVLPITKAGEMDVAALDEHMRTLHDAGVLGAEVDVSALVVVGD